MKIACRVRLVRPIALLASACLLSACPQDGGAPPTLTLEQAKVATAEVAREAFVPPPRSIKDIAAILDSQKQADPQRNERLVGRADGAVPTDGSLGQRIRALSGRGMAALKIGRSKQALDDLLAANDLAERARRMKPNQRAALLQRLSEVQYVGGLPQDAMASLSRAIEVNHNIVRSVMWSSKLAIWQALSGDLDAADRTIEKAETDLSIINNTTKGAAGAQRWEQNAMAVYAAVNRAAARIKMGRGDFAGAETQLRTAYRNMLAYQEQADEGSRRLRRRLIEYIQADLGLAILRQGRHLEAEVEIRAALEAALKRTGRYSPEVARFTANLAAVMASQGRPQDAEKLARASVEILNAIGSEDGSRFRSLAQVMLGKSLASQRRWADANAAFAPLLTRESPDYAFAIQQVGPLYALGLVLEGDPARAMPAAQDAVDFLEPRLGRKHQTTAEALAALATAQAAAGKRTEALANFAESVPILLSRSRSADDETDSTAGRAAWLNVVLEAYIRLLSEIGDMPRSGSASENPIDRAFLVADAARGQRVQNALAASAARASVRDSALADLVRREQDTVKRIGALNALYAAAVGIPEAQRNNDALDALRKRIDTLRGARAAMAEAIEKRFPDYASLMQPKPATIADVRAALRPGEALIATYAGARQTYVWALTQTGPAKFARVPLTADRLGAAVRELRAAMTPRGDTLASIPAYDVRLAYRLYQSLLEPVRDGWQQAKVLLIVAHGPLGQLPFAMLTTKPASIAAAKPGDPKFAGYRGMPWLMRSHAVAVLPSVGSLATLRKTPAPAATRQPFVGFGDPVFNLARAGKTDPGTVVAMRGGSGLTLRLRSTPPVAATKVTLADLPRLPDTAAEVRSIASALGANPSRDVYVGEDASETRLHQLALDHYRIVAFATHGLIPGDLDGLTQPALALSAPRSGAQDEDGLLTMGEILGLKLDADWVVLSACNTAAGDGKGAEAVSGLGRAFFYAGTRAILASNWPVETTSARLLTTDLFRRQATDPQLGRAEALRRAMLALADDGLAKDDAGAPLFAYAHPIFWAPFSLFGDGAGAPGR